LRLSIHRSLRIESKKTFYALEEGMKVVKERTRERVFLSKKKRTAAEYLVDENAFNSRI
jgi:hypothetical protein